MDALTSLVTALAAGAAAALKPTVEQAVKDSYTARKGSSSAVCPGEPGPARSESQLQEPPGRGRGRPSRGWDRQGYRGAATSTDPGDPPASRPETAAAIGVTLTDIEGAALTIRRVTATGAGVTVEHARLSGDIMIEDVQAGGRGGIHPNP